MTAVNAESAKDSIEAIVNNYNSVFNPLTINYSNGQNRLEYNMLSLLYVKDI